jgi:succinate dehydrogenase hydrophobic anchor subunit
MLFEKIELEPNETVLKVSRKHWFIIATEIISALLVAVLPLFAMAAFLLIDQLHPEIFFPHQHTPLVLFASAFWLLITILTTFMIWTHYFLDLWVITDRRIIVIDQIHFFNRKVSSFRLERLQDIKASVDGVIPTLLNFGTLHVHTAGNNEENFTTKGLPDPRELQALIQKATDERLKSLHGAAAQAIID